MNKKIKHIINVSIALFTTLAVAVCAIFVFGYVSKQIFREQIGEVITPPGTMDTDSSTTYDHHTKTPSGTNDNVSSENKTFEPLINAYEVVIDGNVVGVFDKYIDVDQIVNKLKDEYENTENVTDVIPEISRKIEIISTKTFAHNITDYSNIVDAIGDSIAFKINAYELSVDNVIIGYFEDEVLCSNIINDAKEKFVSQNFSGSEVTSISYDREFKISPVYVSKDDLEMTTHNDAVDIIISDRFIDKIINVSSIADLDNVFKNRKVSSECDYETLVNKLEVDGSVDVIIQERLVNFRVQTNTVKYTSIPYTTTYRTNAAYDHTVTKIVNAGANGTKTDVYTNSYFNTDITSSVLISSNTKNPVTRVVEYGTKLSIRTNITALTGAGYFKWPSSGVYLNAFVNGGHTGVDVTSSYGTPIYASATGIVTTTAYDQYGYGNYVKIQHNNGYTTLYGHMSKYIVSPGQKVTQGQIIGYVGSTGNSTGPHCHFTIIITKSGIAIDPLLLLYGY